MSSKTPKQALDAPVERFRRAIQCVSAAEVRGSGHAIGRLNTITLIPHGGRPGNVTPLRLIDGRRDLVLGVYYHYTVVHVPDDQVGGPYKISPSRYMYDLLDHDERELFVYHWHPEGVSPVHFPHLHFSGAAPIPLPPARGDDRLRQLAVDRAHFPTGRVALEDVIALLIRDFGVEPRRADWQDVIEQNLGVLRSGHPWE